MTLKTYSLIGLAAYAVLSVTDLGLTYRLLKLNGDAYESNPVAAVWLERFGWAGLAAFKAVTVLVFTAAIVGVMRKRPGVAAAVVTLGCGVLLSVATYSQGLIKQSHREAAAMAAAAEPIRPVHRTPAGCDVD